MGPGMPVFLVPRLWPLPSGTPAAASSRPEDPTAAPDSDSEPNGRHVELMSDVVSGQIARPTRLRGT